MKISCMGTFFYRFTDLMFFFKALVLRSALNYLFESAIAATFFDN
jgi:hypothetical protein